MLKRSDLKVKSIPGSIQDGTMLLSVSVDLTQEKYVCVDKMLGNVKNAKVLKIEEELLKTALMEFIYQDVINELEKLKNSSFLECDTKTYRKILEFQKSLIDQVVTRF